ELIERPALHHRKLAARFAIGRPPIGPTGQRHVRWIGVEIEAVDGAADDLLFPVIVEIGQQRSAGSTHRGMNIAVDPRRRHGGFLGYSFLAVKTCRALNVPPMVRKRKGRYRLFSHATRSSSRRKQGPIRCVLSFWARSLRPSVSPNAGGYGSLRSQGRRERIQLSNSQTVIASQRVARMRAG